MQTKTPRPLLLLPAVLAVHATLSGCGNDRNAPRPTTSPARPTESRLPAPLYTASAAVHDAMVGYPPVLIQDMEIDPAGCKINGALRPVAPNTDAKPTPFIVSLTPTADGAASTVSIEPAAGPHAKQIINRALNELGATAGGRPGKPPRPELHYAGPQLPAHEQPLATSDRPWRTLEGHTGSVMSVAFSPDGRTMASTSRDSTVAIWDVETFQVRHRLTAHTGSIYCATYSPDGKLLATCGDDLSIRLWTVPTYTPARTIERAHSAPVRSLSFSPDGATLASCSMDQTVRLWDVATGAHKRTLTGHAGALKAVMFSPEGKQLVSAGQERIVRIWDVATGAVVRDLTSPEPSHEAAAWSPDGRWIVANGTFGPTVAWEAATGKPWRRIADHNVEGDSIACAPNAAFIAAGHKDRTIDLREPSSGRLLARLTADKGRIESLAFTPDARLLAAGAGGNDTVIRIWNLAELQPPLPVGPPSTNVQP